MISPCNKLILFILTCSLPFNVTAQKIIVNTLDGIYELSGTPGDCTLGPAIPYCNNNSNGRIYSIALHNNILYFVSASGDDLYRVELGKPQNCERVAWLPEDGYSKQYNALTVDLYGNVYALALTGQLVRYRYGDAAPTILGRVPEGSGGDMLYHKGDLYYAAINGDIYKVNLQNPEASTRHMSVPGFSFIGLISFPFACNENKIYGITGSYPNSELIELNFDNKTYSGVLCTLPIAAYDAASVVEDGRTAGILLDSVTLKGPCGNEGSGNAQLHAFSATPGSLTFTMDEVSNTTGYFESVNTGTRAIRITNTRGCVLDTSIMVNRGLSSQFNVIKKAPTSCAHQDGELSVSGATSGYLPLSFSHNGGPYSAVSHFTGLGSGRHTLSVRDQSGCQLDTIVTLSHIEATSIVKQITTTSALCGGSNGSIHLELDPSLVNWQTSIDNGPAGKQLQFSNLAAKAYTITVFYVGSATCSWDTTVVVQDLPVSNIELRIKSKNPTCLLPESGELLIEVNGLQGPYRLMHGTMSYPAGSMITGLKAGVQNVDVVNGDGCLVRTITEKLIMIEEPACDRFIMPNAFTPNGDGNNETIKPVHSPFVREMQCDIFNRYGQQVYRYSGSGNGWDGTLSGKPQPIGNYIWSARYLNYRGEVITRKGSFILLR